MTRDCAKQRCKTCPRWGTPTERDGCSTFINVVRQWKRKGGCPCYGTPETKCAETSAQ